MANHESELQVPNLFGREPYTVSQLGDENVFYRISVNPEELEGFDESVLSKELVAGAVARTLEGMKYHGASALGLDLDSMFGRIHATGHIYAALDVGANILNDLAPRDDGLTWREWLRAEFPNAIAAVYIDRPDIVKLAREQMGDDILF